MGTLLEANLKRGALNRSPSLEAITLRYHSSLVQPVSSSSGGIRPGQGSSTSGFKFRGRVQGLCGNRPEGGQVKRPKKISHICFAKVTHESLKMAIFFFGELHKYSAGIW